MLPLHHDPVLGRAYGFQPHQHRFAPLRWLTPSGSPESRTRHHAVISRVRATGPRLPCFQSGWQDSNLRSCAPKAHGFAATLHPVESERADLNRRSPAPRAGAIAGLRYVLLSSGSCGSRTRLYALKGRDPQSDRRTSRSHSARTLHAVGLPEGAQISRSGSGGARIRVPSFSARC